MLTLTTAIADFPAGGTGTVHVAPGWYGVQNMFNDGHGDSAIRISDRAVTVRGTTGNPADVVVERVNSANYRIFTLAHPGARVENLTVRNGRADNGAGIFLFAVDAVAASNCVVTACSGVRGGGIHILGGGLATHCVVTNNTLHDAYGEGGAAGVYIQSGRLEHSLVTGNTAPINNANLAGGVRVNLGSFMVNCTVVGNHGNNHGGVVAAEGGLVVNTVIAGNSTAWGGNAAAFIKCFTDTVAAINPGCRNYPAEVMLDENYYPAHGSPLIGASIDASLYFPAYVKPAVDLAGNPRSRPNGSHDAGCYEKPPGGTLLMIR